MADDCTPACRKFGCTSDDIQLAHSLAFISARLDPKPKHTRYMVAAAWDRFMLKLKRPQWYGTQSVRGADDKWALHPVDESAVTDADRISLAVSTLDEARAEIVQMNLPR